VNDIHLAVVCKQRYLSLIFDDNLSWSHHVSKVCQSMSYYLYLLSRDWLFAEIAHREFGVISLSVLFASLGSSPYDV